MAYPEIKNVVEAPDGVNATVDNGVVTVQGGNATLSRTLRHPDVEVSVEDGNLVVVCPRPRRKTRALTGTWTSHLENMVHGVQEDFECRLKVVYSHFPIKVKVDGDAVLIDNFLGEKTARRARVMGDTNVRVDGEEIVATGPNKEHVGQTAANIEQATRVKGYDLRVFQDGIYITTKAG